MRTSLLRAIKILPAWAEMGSRKPLLLHQRQQELPALDQELMNKRNEGNTGMLVTVTDDPGAVNMDKAEELDPSFALVFTIRVF